MFSVKVKQFRRYANSFIVKSASAAFLTVAMIGLQSDPSQARQAYSGIVVDANTGKTIYARNADGRRYPASLTKMMTLYVLFQEMKSGRIKKSTRFKVSRHAAAQPPSKLGLKRGQSIRAEDAIKALVTKSANDVAVVVAEAIGKTESGFARRMTKTARRIGMKRTTFRNASGLPNKHQVTTARDMATLGMRLQRDFPGYYRYFKTKAFKYRGRVYRSHNRLLGRYKGTDGIKTGYTRASGFNLTSSVRRGRKHLVGVVLGGKSGRSRDRQMRKILSKAFPNASTKRRKLRKTQVASAKVPTPVIRPASTGTLTDSDLKVPAKNVGKPLVISSASKPVQATLISAQGTQAKAQKTKWKSEDSNTASEEIEATKTIPLVKTADHANGTWSIQIGAYAKQEDAMRRLKKVKKTGLKNLYGKKAIALAFYKEDQVLYRARFAGFDKRSARRACTVLNRKSINCLALAP